ncbi:MAG TPA: hypothetical protein VHO25_02080 [Polyangiaceae bacterium]|nr:hypothetical protein [Polyangiaceae bacterium]
MRPFSLERVEPWWGSLGASLLLHGAVVTGLLLSLFRAPAAVREVPDLWQGDLVTVDTWSEDPLGGVPAVAPSPPGVVASEPAAPPTSVSEPAVVNHRVTVKQNETMKHSETVRQTTVAPKTPRAKPVARAEPSQPVDSNQALLAKVMGFKPASNSAPEPPGGSEQASSVSAAPGGSHSQSTVRNLPKAFTRALANAAAGDAARYSRMSSGKLEEARITVEVGQKGEVVGHALNREASTRMKELVRRTLASLGAGQFALRETQVSAGTLRLEVEVWLSGDSEGNERVTEIGYEAPRPERDGKAYFLLGTGWRFEAKVRELR